jgi:SAM-dependent methyltransferase
MKANAKVEILLKTLRSGESTSRELIESLIPGSFKVIDLGCGGKKLKGAIGIDKLLGDSIDICHDIEAGPLPFESDSIDIVYSDQFLEHTENLINVISEIFRVLSPGGCMICRVPYFRSSWAYIDPTHKRFFTINTLDYFAKGNYFSDNYSLADFKFSEIYKSLEFTGRPRSKIKRILHRSLTNLALADPARYENSALSSAFPFACITYCLFK